MTLVIYWFSEVKDILEQDPVIIQIEKSVIKKPDFKIAMVRDYEDQRIIEAIITEAISESEKGIIAVAWVFKNRLDIGMSLGSCGQERKDRDRFISQQPQWKKDLVSNIWQRIKAGQLVDPTNGALYFENINAFGSPYWIDDVEFVVEIGNHKFYK